MTDTGPRPGADAGHLRVSRSLRIPLDELRWRFTTSGGPGGQHANKSSTRAEVSFDVERSPSLGPRQRARLLERIGPTARAASGDERSQARNRALALERLRTRLSDALRIERARRPTRVPAVVSARRVADKRRHGARKRERARPPEDD